MAPRLLTGVVGLLSLLSSATSPGDATGAATVRYWFSPDGKELYLAVPAAPAEPGGRLYYFNNDAGRLCYTFAVRGQWALDPAIGIMISQDRAGKLGQYAASADELGVADGGNLVDTKVRALQHTFRTAAGKLKGHQLTSEPRFAVQSCDVPARPNCVRWQATAEASFQGRPAVQKQSATIVEPAPGWVLSIEATEDVAREAVESLQTTSDAQCYWPLIRRNFPQIDKH